MLVTDNLELGCSIIERAATDKAVRDIDKSLATAYEARATARARGQPFYERALYAQSQAGRFPAALPESLKPKPGLPQQQRVYEDFARMPRALPPHPMSGFRPDGAPPASPMQVCILAFGLHGRCTARVHSSLFVCVCVRVCLCACVHVHCLQLGIRVSGFVGSTSSSLHGSSMVIWSGLLYCLPAFTGSCAPGLHYHT